PVLFAILSKSLVMIDGLVAISFYLNFINSLF
ncbi:MAG: hypothetical protein ACI8YP_003490, partial [Algoriphagus sp.]